jgi:hypothetical protein
LGKPAGVREPQAELGFRLVRVTDALREIIHKLETISGAIGVEAAPPL